MFACSGYNWFFNSFSRRLSPTLFVFLPGLALHDKIEDIKDNIYCKKCWLIKDICMTKVEV